MIVAVPTFILFSYSNVKSVLFTNIVVVPLGIGTETSGVGIIALPVYVFAPIVAIVALLKLYFSIVTSTLPLFDA